MNAENAHLESLVQDVRIPPEMSCKDRRQRAEEIGYRQAMKRLGLPDE